MGSVDAKKLISEVAARHGVLIREDDPAMALVTMSEIVLEEALRKAEVRLGAVLAEAENRQKGLQQEAVSWVQEEIGRAGSTLRAQIQRDIDGARLQARELVVQLNQVYSRTAVRRWLAVGVVSGLILLLIGLALGLGLEKLLR
jgi:hypothetical protein